MLALTDRLDLASLHLGAGEGRRLELAVEIEPLTLGGERYAAEPSRPAAVWVVGRLVGPSRSSRTAEVGGAAGRCRG
jgi:hypothetical protein